MTTRRLTILISVLGVAACSDAPGSVRVLEDAGYTDIQTTGYSPFSCGKGDRWATGFTAKGPTGRAVKGVVCAGILKGATIRFF